MKYAVAHCGAFSLNIYLTVKPISDLGIPTNSVEPHALLLMLCTSVQTHAISEL